MTMLFASSPRIAAVLAVAAALAVPFAARAAAHQPGAGPGPMMMGQPGAMGGPGMPGPGMMGGYGPVPPTMGGPGMMGPGVMMGPGMMGPGMMMSTPCPQMARQAERPLSVDDARAWLEQWLAMHGNPRLAVGSVTEKDERTIVADIVTKEGGALVDRLEIDRQTGMIRRAG
ncbi:hypothetical protein HRbin40_01376 [bacterium HR40]|nr:hypothetical protein HRbin40_01376 [bacterium HR40]